MFLFMDYRKRKLENKIIENADKLIKIQRAVEEYDFENKKDVQHMQKTHMMHRIKYKASRMEGQIVKFQINNERLKCKVDKSIFSFIGSLFCPCSSAYLMREKVVRHVEKADKKLTKLLDMYKYI